MRCPETGFTRKNEKVEASGDGEDTAPHQPRPQVTIARQQRMPTFLMIAGRHSPCILEAAQIRVLQHGSDFSPHQQTQYRSCAHAQLCFYSEFSGKGKGKQQYHSSRTNSFSRAQRIHCGKLARSRVAMCTKSSKVFAQLSPIAHGCMMMIRHVLPCWKIPRTGSIQDTLTCASTLCAS